MDPNLKAKLLAQLEVLRDDIAELERDIRGERVEDIFSTFNDVEHSFTMLQRNIDRIE